VSTALGFDFTPYVGKMYKGNDFLLLTGRIEKITRGRMSSENKAFLAEAVAAGVKFSNFTPTEAVNSSGNTVIKNTSPRASSNIDNFAEEFVRYPGAHGGIYGANEVWKVTLPNGKTLPTPNGMGGLRETCANCRLSLVGHMCQTPQIDTIEFGRVSVTIERR